MDKSSLNNDLKKFERVFERVQDNFLKTKKLFGIIKSSILNKIDISEHISSLENLLNGLTVINGWKPEKLPINPNIQDVIELEKQLEIYDRKLKQQKLQFIKPKLIELIKSVDNVLGFLAKEAKNEDSNEKVVSPYFDELKNYIKQIKTLSVHVQVFVSLDFDRHLFDYGQVTDLCDIIRFDWPDLKAELEKSLYSEKEPVPIDIDDLALFVNSKPEINFEPLIHKDIPSKDSKVIDRMNSAKSSYTKPGATLDSQRQAVRDLADVLEHLRPKIKSHLTSKDEGDLFNIANNFGIRHYDDKQKTDYDLKLWLSWMFYFYLATIHLILGKINLDKEK